MKKMRLAVLLLVLAAVATGCAATASQTGESGARSGKWQKAEMPDGGSFDGVYQSDWGRLELTVQYSGRVTGLFEEEAKHSGRIDGRQEGNLLFFDWQQWNYEMGGKVRESKGKGVFQYVVETVANSDTKSYVRLWGWFGYADGGMENRWNAVKMSAQSKKRLMPFRRQAGYMEQESAFEENVGFPDNKDQSPRPAAKPPEKSGDKATPKGESDGLDLF